MNEQLIRQELPIQSVKERGDSCTATVPVHLDILNLPLEIRTNTSVISGAREIVGEWYNKDMEYYLKVLKKDRTEFEWLRGYNFFSDSWNLRGEPDENGFLKLIWTENGDSHAIQFIKVPVILYNQHTESGEFCTPEYCKSKGWIEIIYRSIRDPEAVNMPPEKMLKYGRHTTKFQPEKGIAEVVANAFCSDYHDNMAKTLLLRDFAVFYLNQLLSVTKNVQQN